MTEYAQLFGDRYGTSLLAVAVPWVVPGRSAEGVGGRQGNPHMCHGITHSDVPIPSTRRTGRYRPD